MNHQILVLIKMYNFRKHVIKINYLAKSWKRSFNVQQYILNILLPMSSSHSLHAL